MDKQLPSALANLSTRKLPVHPLTHIVLTRSVPEIFKLLMQVALIVYVQPVMLATIPPCYILVYLIQKVYLRNSRQLRFLDLEARSRLNTNFLDTVCSICS